MDGQPPVRDVDQHQKTKSIWYLILLTISIGGLQIAWSVEMSNGSPYLLSLGISKSLMALVWIAGPLSGTLVQPYVGMLSDNCRIPWGKRKPFMVGGTIATVISLMSLAWTKEIVGGFLGLFGAAPGSDGVKYTTIVVAVLWVYVLDFAINTVQAAIRAFIVDCAPTHQQESANAMASRFLGIGNIAGYLAGYLNLPSVFWFFGDTQFKDLCVIASIALGATIALSCLFIHERDPRLDGPPTKDKAGVMAFFRKIFTSIKRLPPQTKRVCQVQFCAWIGFFPMLFYTSEYIAEIYAEPYLEANPNMTPAELDKLYEDATREGTFALLIFAIISLATNVFLPFFVEPSMAASSPVEAPGSLKDYGDEEKAWLDYLVIPGFTLRRAWMFAQILFTCSMLCTVFVRTVTAATILIGLVGITWALTLWAPWAIISAEISRRDEIRRSQYAQRNPSSSSTGGVASLDGYSSDENRERALDEDKQGDADDQAGVILGIHNMAIAAPQILATVASSIIFRVFQKPRGVPGDHSIAVVLALGGITVLISVFFIHRIRDDPGTPADAMSAAEGGEAGSRPSTSHSRSRSFEQPPRASLERAALVRNKSFGGVEY
jgi:solute carrier family 45 protein 1/2/4